MCLINTLNTPFFLECCYLRTWELPPEQDRRVDMARYQETEDKSKRICRISLVCEVSSLEPSGDPSPG